MSSIVTTLTAHENEKPSLNAVAAFAQAALDVAVDAKAPVETLDALLEALRTLERAHASR